VRRGGIIGAGPRRAAEPGKLRRTWRGQLLWYATEELPFPTPPAGTVAYDTTTGKRAVSDGTYWREDEIVGPFWP
jgi:hypothetical protein